MDCIKQFAAKLCLAVFAAGVLVASGPLACAQIASLDKGHQLLVNNGLQIWGLDQCSGCTFNYNGLANANFNGVIWSWGVDDAPHPKLNSLASGQKWGKWVDSNGSPATALDAFETSKIADLIAAGEFVSTLSLVDPNALTHLAICASAQYGLAALARGSRVGRFISVAGWYHDTTSVAAFYGGLAGVARRLELARAALERYRATGHVETVPAYKPGDETAGMFFELDYYANRSRGAVPAWRNEMATLSWAPWLLFDGLSAADRVDTPALFVHSDGCVFPDHVRLVHGKLRGPKQLLWATGTQTDFYDQPEQVDFVVNAADAFLKGKEMSLT